MEAAARRPLAEAVTFEDTPDGPAPLYAVLQPGAETAVETPAPEAGSSTPHIRGVDEVEAAEDEASQEDDTDKDREEAVHVADSVRVYLNQIGKTALLDAEQEVELAKRIEAGQYAAKKRAAIEAKRKDSTADVAGMVAKDQKVFAAKVEEKVGSAAYLRDLKALELDGTAAKNHLLGANLRLVASIAKRYTGKSDLKFLDLIQEGNIGLIRAVEKFDYTKGYKFSTYATWWIRQAITRAMADEGRLIRYPVHFAEQVNKFERIWREQYNALGREPEPEEMAREMDKPLEQVVELQEYARMDRRISLDQTIGEDNESPLGDFIEDADALDVAMAAVLRRRNEDLRALLTTIEEERERTIITLSFGLDGQEPRTQGQIGELLGLSGSRVGQLRRETMAVLRAAAHSSGLRDYLLDD